MSTKPAKHGDCPYLNAKNQSRFETRICISSSASSACAREDPAFKGKVERADSKHKPTTDHAERRLVSAEIWVNRRKAGVVLHQASVFGLVGWEECEGAHDQARDDPSHDRSQVLPDKCLAVEGRPCRGQ